LVVADALKQAQIDQDIDQRVQVGNGFAVADVRTLDAQGFCLAVDASWRCVACKCLCIPDVRSRV
jgi:hypothetical protein